MSLFQLSGTLDEIALPDVTRLLTATHKTGRLAVTGEGGSTASIYLERGEIVDAQAANSAGLDAIKHLALFAKGHFEFIDGTVAASRNLTAYPTTEIIRLLETRMQESRQVAELAAADHEVPRYMGGAIPAGLEVSAAELAVALRSANGTQTVAQIALELTLDLLLVKYAVARFRAAGLMEIVPGAAPAAPPVVEKPAVGIPGASPHPIAESHSTQPKYWRGRRIG